MADIYGKGPKGAATRLHSLVVRHRGACEVPGCGETEYRNLQCAHIISRRYSATRTMEANALCMCRSHHFKFTNHPEYWLEFVRGHIGFEAYDALWLVAREVTKMNWPAEVERLKAVWRELNAG